MTPGPPGPHGQDPPEPDRHPSGDDPGADAVTDTDAGADAAPPRGRRRGAVLLRRAYVVGLGVLAVWLVWTNRTDLADLLASAQWGWLAVALVLSIGQLLPSALMWQQGVAHLGHPITVTDSAVATGRAIMTRYLPGGVWYAVGRGASLRAATGAPGRIVATVAVLEMAVSLVVAIALIGLLLPFTDVAVPTVTLVLGVVGALVVASPPAINLAMRTWANRRGGLAPVLTWNAWMRLAGLAVLHWVWSVGSFAVYLAAFPGLDLDVGFTGLAIRFLVAWVIGFLTLFAPQGAGIFETVLAALLVTQDRVLVAVAAGGYRAVLLVRDLIVGAAAFLGTPRPRAR